MEETLFVGPMLVVQVTDHTDIKTYDQNNKVIIVSYAGGKTEIMTQKCFDIIKTSEPSDLTTIRNKKLEAIRNEIYPIVAAYVSTIGTEHQPGARVSLLQAFVAVSVEYGIKSSEATSMLNTMQAEMLGIVGIMASELDNQFNRVTNYLWTPIVTGKQIGRAHV